MRPLLKKLFPFLYKTSWKLKPEHEVELAFVSDGVEYFCFTNGFDVYSERYAAAADAINMLEMRVNREYLKTMIGLHKEYTRKGQNDNCAILIHHLEERMNHISNEELFLQLAAVWYFDKQENCYVYNPEYGEKKIARWRKDKELLSFFLQGQLSQFMPLLPSSIPHIQNYTKETNLELLRMLRFHLSSQSESSSNKDLISSIKLQILKLEELLAEN
ncbi:MAG: hypothetical protein V4714_08180 [Bacteroidota bacterium]